MYPVNDDSASFVNEEGDRGFISLFRSIRKHWIWKDAEKLKWWIDILLEVNHKPKKVLIGNKLIDCNRGQSINSLLTWAKRWRTNVSAVRRFLHLLESDSMIRIENVSKTTRITVCKYESYQDWRNDSETKMKGLRNDDETEVKTNNNANNANKGLGDVPPPPKPEKKKAFIPPTNEAVTEYIKGLTDGNSNSGSVAQIFMDYYSGNGWKVGKNKMVDWQATVRNCLNWEKNQKLIASGRPETPSKGVDMDEYLGRPPIQSAFD